MRATTDRGTNGRPSTEAVLDPQAQKELEIRLIFTRQGKLLSKLFPKDGDVILARTVSSAIMASRALDKDGRIALRDIAAEDIAEKCVAAHHMGLEVGSECYLIPYGKKLQLQTGPQGLIKLMMQSGFVKSVVARSVREGDGGDVFDHDLGPAGYITHKKGANRDSCPVTFAYAFIKTTTGGEILDVLSRGEIDHFRSLSKMKDGGPMWIEHFDGACRKTMIHRIAEFVPRSPVLSAALRQNEQGGVEVPEEIMAAVRAKMAAEMMGPAPAANGVPVVVDASGAQAEPGAGA